MSAPIDGVVAVGAVVTYMLASDEYHRPVQLGEFPHSAIWWLVPGAGQCEAEISVTDSAETSTERCTRDAGHRGVHVHHQRPGLPLLAWLRHGSQNGVLR